MTYTELKAEPGSLVYSNAGLVVGRINNDLTEDNRWTANGKCSIANGFIKASGISPKDARSFHKSVETNPNGYILKGYTIVLQLKELPVEMWAVKAAEVLGGEFNDFEEMLEQLSKQPEKEREAKLAVLEKFFQKEKKSYCRKTRLTPTARQKVDEIISELSARYENKGRVLYNTETIINEIMDAYLDKEEITIPMSMICGCHNEHRLNRIKDKFAAMKYFDETYAAALYNTPYKNPKAFARHLWKKIFKDEYDALRKAFVAHYVFGNSFKKYSLYHFVQHYKPTNSHRIPEINEVIERKINEQLSLMLSSKAPMKEFDIRHRVINFKHSKDLMTGRDESYFTSGNSFKEHRVTYEIELSDWKEDLELYRIYLLNNAS